MLCVFDLLHYQRPRSQNLQQRPAATWHTRWHVHVLSALIYNHQNWRATLAPSDHWSSWQSGNHRPTLSPCAPTHDVRQMSWHSNYTQPPHSARHFQSINYKLYTVSQKNCAKLFLSWLCQISANCKKIFGTKMAERISLCEVLSFSTSPNSCQPITVLNADVPNCYITL